MRSRDVERPLRAARVAEELLEQAQVVVDVPDVLLLQHGPDDRDRREDDQRDDRDVDRTEELEERVVPGRGDGGGLGLQAGGAVFRQPRGETLLAFTVSLKAITAGRTSRPAVTSTLRCRPRGPSPALQARSRCAMLTRAPPWHSLQAVGALAAASLASVLVAREALARLGVDDVLGGRAACPSPRRRGTSKQDLAAVAPALSSSACGGRSTHRDPRRASCG